MWCLREPFLRKYYKCTYVSRYLLAFQGLSDQIPADSVSAARRFQRLSTCYLQAQSIVSPILTCVFSNAQIEVEIRTLTDRRGLEYRVWSASTSLALAYHTRYSNPRCDWHKPHIANSREIIVMSTGFNYMNILSSTRIIIVIFFRLNL